MKSISIENCLNAYFDGVLLPRIDLSKAKAEVRRVRSRRRGRIALAVLSAAASLVLIVAVALATLPSLANRKFYSIADATPTSVTYTSLCESESYAAVTAPFAPFSLASNASAEYTMYEVKGQEVLLRIDITFVGNGMQARACVYVDLSNGKHTPEELASYQELEESYYSGYRYETVYKGGEYVSEAYGSLPSGETCYIDMTSNNSQTLVEFIKLIRR